MPKRPKVKPYSDDNDITKRAENDDFWIRRLLKFGLLACALTIMFGLTIVFCVKLGTDDAFRNQVCDVLQKNAVSIIFGVSAILGVNLHSLNLRRKD
jgi:hypothetical protein